MSDEQQQQPEQSPATPSTDESQNTEARAEQSIPYNRFKQVNDEKNQLKARLEALEQAEQERQRAKALEEGNYQKLIDDLTPQAQRAEELAAQLQAYQERDLAELNAELESIDEAMRGLVISAGDPTMQLAWVRNAKRVGLFNKPSPPQSDSGIKGDQKPPDTSNLTEGEKLVRDLARNRGYLKNNK